MRIKVINNSKSEVILVRRISWKQRCEEQLTKIIEEMKDLKKNMEANMSKIKKYAEEVYGEEYPDLSKENVKSGL